MSDTYTSQILTRHSIRVREELPKAMPAITADSIGTKAFVAVNAASLGPLRPGPTRRFGGVPYLQKTRTDGPSGGSREATYHESAGVEPDGEGSE